ncbi:hypothetical protein AAL_02485 [Moelleriella libera RCEF 2490]|uniref:Uncharacterized protein n=1 Tax=Moelleriella libera RCEF 2490 TaxID=1081109 RepID=A0A168ELT5_9HYPO|nr:hypothetical protein AAL_02485 [Moelleriella libera RCEF 2490]
MQLSIVALATLPALALATNTNPVTTATVSPTVTTTTCFSTLRVVKTITLSVGTSTWALNTTSYVPTGTIGTTSLFTPTAYTTAPSAPIITATGVPVNSGSALDVTKVAFAGLAGMIVAGIL